MLLSIEREINGQFMDNPSAVIDEFAVMKKGRLESLNILKIYNKY